MASNRKRLPNVRKSNLDDFCRDGSKCGKSSGSNSTFWKTNKSTCWKTSEKKAFLEGLRKYGLGNLEMLEKVVKTRNQTEIKFYVEKWKMRAVREKNKMNDQSEMEGKQAPIESWGDIVKKNVHIFFRNDDYSKIIVEVLKAAKTEEHHETPKKDSEPDFRRLYSYLVNLLEGNIPPDLPPAESEVIIILLKDLAQVVKYPLLQEEKEFLRTFNTEQQEKFTTGQTKRQEQQEVPSSPNHVQSVKGSSGGSSGYKRSLKMLPNTIKSLKVQNCLNPLKIPVSLLEKETEFIKKWRTSF